MLQFSLYTVAQAKIKEMCLEIKFFWLQLIIDCAVSAVVFCAETQDVYSPVSYVLHFTLHCDNGFQ